MLLAFVAVCLLAWSSSTVVISETAGSGLSVAGNILSGILPQLFPDFMSTLIYRFDMNLRNATVLGLVGAGALARR